MTQAMPKKGESVDFKISQEARRRILIGLSWEPIQMDESKLQARKGKTARQLNAATDDGGNPSALKEAAIDMVNDGLRAAHHVKEHILDSKDALKRAAYIDQYTQSSQKFEDTAGRETGFTHNDLDLYCYIFNPYGVPVAIVGPESENLTDSALKVYHSGDNESGIGGGVADDEQIYIETKNIPDDYHHFFVVVKSDCQYDLDEIPDAVIRLADSKTDSNVLKLPIKPPAGIRASAYIFCHLYRDGDAWKVRNINEFADFDSDWEKILVNHIKEL